MSERRIGSTEPRMTVINPSTGELLTPDEMAQKVLHIANELEEDALLLQDLVLALGRVTARYQSAVDQGASKSTARAATDREREGRMYAETLCMPGDALDLFTRKTHLEHAVRMHRDHEHTLRAILSGWQTAARTIGIVVSV